MKIAFYIAHPSQYYVHKNVINRLKQSGSHEIKIFIKSKDILEDLLKSTNTEFVNVYTKTKKKGLKSLLSSVFKKNFAFYKKISAFKPDLIVSAASDISQVSFIKGIPSIILNDDDAKVCKMSVLFGWPFSSVILSPKFCDMGYWARKTVSYQSFQKLAYLHPNHFKPNPEVLLKYNLKPFSYSLLRTVSLTGHHDINIRGLNNLLVGEVIEKLKPFGQIFISSESGLPDDLLGYKLNINLTDIHHIIYYANILIGDSQSMAHEAALLGTPSIRFNDFAGKIGVLETLEHDYKLTFGISPDNPNGLLNKIGEIQNNLSQKNTFYKEKSEKMLLDMIDFSDFLVWFIENYPTSARIMKENPDYQYRFK